MPGPPPVPRLCAAVPPVPPWPLTPVERTAGNHTRHVIPSRHLHGTSAPIPPTPAPPTPVPPGHPATLGQMGYRVGSVRYCRPEGVVHRKVPPGSCSTFHRGCCLSLWSRRHLGPPLHR